MKWASKIAFFPHSQIDLWFIPYFFYIFVLRFEFTEEDL